MKKIVAIVIACVAGFSAGAFGQNSEEWRQHVTIVDSDFNPLVAVKGPDHTFDVIYGAPAYTWLLRSAIVKKEANAIGVTFHMLPFTNIYDASTWRFWNYATTNSAEVLEITNVSRRVIDCKGVCTYQESFVVQLPAALLSRATTEDIKIKIVSKSGSEFVIAIDPKDAKHQLAAVEAIRSTLLKK